MNLIKGIYNNNIFKDFVIICENVYMILVCILSVCFIFRIIE